MGGVSDDMNRLCGEIRSLRKARKEYNDSMKEVADNLRRSVSTMLTDFATTRARRARTAKADSSAFVNHLKQTTARLRKDVAADLAGARRVWRGKA